MNSTKDSLRWLLENFNYIDSVTIIDDKGTVIVKQRFNPRYTDEENKLHNEWSVGKNLLDVFPSLSHEDSSLLQALTKGKVSHFQAQSVTNHEGKVSVTNNITFPIVARGKTVGAVELSRDITHIEKKLKPEKPKTIPHTGSGGGRSQYTIDHIVGESSVMQDLKRTIIKIADSTSSVMVCGETGTGKELVVSAIHNAGDRKDKPFVAINCAALPESILEGLLFGSQKGAFTGAENKKGMFEEANGGTIYLDEMNSMPIMLQAKLLRVLQEKEVTPLGATKPVKLDVRIIASVNKPIGEIIRSGQMREDLLYRLNTINIQIPPLRERMEDMELLTEHFIEKYNLEFGKNIAGITEEVSKFLATRTWRGNVRELEHVVEFAMNIAGDGEKINLADLPAYLTEVEDDREELHESTHFQEISLTDALESYEKKLILDALKKSGWKVVDAAKLLRIPRTSLQYKMEK
ncbi:MAG: sigma 54-interacting transcriptional regulator, partial [Firmicutes bacterium]|nr:sigma 54-interacting transcriptional regulator [Bacillota bacterium]